MKKLLLIFAILITEYSLQAQDTLQKPTVLLLNNGKSFSGQIMKENSESILLKTANSEYITIDKSDLKNYIAPDTNQKKSPDYQRYQQLSTFSIRLNLGGVSQIQTTYYSVGLSYELNNFSVLFKIGTGSESSQKGFFGGTTNPSNELTETALLIGYQSGWRGFNLSLYAGLNYLSGTKRGKHLFTKNGGFLNPGDAFYEPIEFNDLGIANEIDLAYNFGKVFAMGTYFSQYISDNISSYNFGIFFRFTGGLN